MHASGPSLSSLDALPEPLGKGVAELFSCFSAPSFPVNQQPAILGESPAFSSLGIGGGGGGGGRDPKSAHQSIVERKKKRKEEKGKGDATPTFPHIAFKRKEKDALRDISLFSFDATAK